jgi:two-component system OmpR family response regulator
MNARRKRMPRQRIKALHEHEELIKGVEPSEQVRWTEDMRALLIEDDKDTAQFVCKGLKEHGYVVDCASEGEEGLYLAATEKYDVLIVDRMLPRLDGLSVVRTLRATGNNAPAIFLTTMSGIDDRVEGLDAGADDYLTKPFALPELLARLSALLRRPPLSETKTVLRAADLEMDLLKRSVRRAGKTIDLQPQEFRILEYLMRSEGRVVTRSMLLENVWDFHFDPLTSVVETHISRLRAKIDKGFKSPLVRTVRGVGYSLRNDV